MAIYNRSLKMFAAARGAIARIGYSRCHGACWIGPMTVSCRIPRQCASARMVISRSIHGPGRGMMNSGSIPASPYHKAGFLPKTKLGSFRALRQRWRLPLTVGGAERHGLCGPPTCGHDLATGQPKAARSMVARAAGLIPAAVGRQAGAVFKEAFMRSGPLVPVISAVYACRICWGSA